VSAANPTGYDFYLHGRARSAEHFQELCTALRTFGFDIVAAYAAAVVQAVPPVVVVPDPREGGGHNFAPRTNQLVINLFRAEFGVAGADFWAVVTRAGLTYMASRRDETYIGPDVEDLHSLTPDEKARLIAAL